MPENEAEQIKYRGKISLTYKAAFLIFTPQKESAYQSIVSLEQG
jgi:hypothetical protein